MLNIHELLSLTYTALMYSHTTHVRMNNSATGWPKPLGLSGPCQLNSRSLTELEEPLLSGSAFNRDRSFFTVLSWRNNNIGRKWYLDQIRWLPRLSLMPFASRLIAHVRQPIGPGTF